MVLFFMVNSTAQEVFFKDNTTHLKTITPSYYYPFQNNGTRLREFITKSTANNMRIVNATEVSAPDRFANNGEALGMNGNSGYISPPDAIFNEMINNKVVNMSFWVKYADEVYNGTKEGVILKIAPKATGSSSKVYIAIKDGKLMIYNMRAKVTGGEVLVPVIKVDFPLDWGNDKPGSETNGFIYISINAIGKDVKKTLISFGRPGGRLYSRSYYMYPFENISTQNDTLLMFGGKLSGVQIKGERMDDIMFFTKNEYTNRILTPEEVLNNFYIQSPLYEGVSYEIKGYGNNIEFWGLQDQKNRDVDENGKYIVLGNDNSRTPFGYNRFNVYKHNTKPLTFKFSSMKFGGDFDLSGYYSIIKPNSDYYSYYTYMRNVDHPDVMYNVDKGTLPLQFRLKSDYYSNQPYYLQFYRSQGKDWLYTSTFNSSVSERAFFSISAAVKVFRGEGRDYQGKVNLHTPAGNVGQNLSYERYPTPGKIGFNFNETNWELRPTVNDNYVINGITPSYERPGRMGKFGGCDDMSERIPIILGENYCTWQFIYVKDNVNGKPLYWLRLHQGNGNQHTSAVIPNGQIILNQVYKNVLQDDGTLLDRLLWTINKAD